MNLLYNPFRSLTIWGVIGVIVPLLVNAFDPHALGPQLQTLVQSCGVLVSMLGLRNAHAKSVQQIAELVSQLAAKR